MTIENIKNLQSINNQNLEAISSKNNHSRGEGHELDYMHEEGSSHLVCLTALKWIVNPSLEANCTNNKSKKRHGNHMI